MVDDSLNRAGSAQKTGELEDPSCFQTAFCVIPQLYGFSESRAPFGWVDASSGSPAACRSTG
jgi:hypothetical protein